MIHLGMDCHKFWLLGDIQSKASSYFHIMLKVFINFEEEIIINKQKENTINT
jgi:hypothetical protein